MSNDAIHITLGHTSHDLRNFDDVDDERKYFFGKKSDRIYVSKRFTDAFDQGMRNVSTVMDGPPEALVAARRGDEVVVRMGQKSRQEIKATIYENDRGIRTLTIQKFNPKSGPSDRIHFSFVGDEIDRLIEFIVALKHMDLDGQQKFKISDNALRDLILNKEQALDLFRKHQDLFLSLAQSETLQRDVVSVGYRRAQLQQFEKMLLDKAFFDAECAKLNLKSEAVWQAFFEANTWIFGYGLSYQFLTGLDGRKLEQITQGNSIRGSGKRVDALMKTQALINAMCFVEIKRHDTPLLASQPYRADAWSAHPDLSGAIAQVQTSVHGAVEDIGRKIELQSADGEPTGEKLFNIQPKAFLVAGTLGQFRTDQGINESKYRSFELFRRNIATPEILTFDELLYRAKFIVENAEPS